MLKPRHDDEGRAKSIAITVFILLVWTIGLISAVYLVYNCLYLLGLAVIFGFNAPPTPVLVYLAFVGKNAIPAVCAIALGLGGLLLWPSARFWVLGLVAVLIETALAIYIFMDPVRLLNFAS